MNANGELERKTKEIGILTFFRDIRAILATFGEISWIDLAKDISWKKIWSLIFLGTIVLPVLGTGTISVPVLPVLFLKTNVIPVLGRGTISVPASLNLT